MKLALFAADAVGLEIAQFCAEQGVPPVCLVLDGADRKGLNTAIRACAGVTNPALIFSSPTLYADETLAALHALDLDLVILAWWPYIIKPTLIRIPRLGCLNFHPSYLPYNRGKHYNFWTLVEETPFGVTIHWIDEGVDSGPIAFQVPIAKSWEDTGATLYTKAQTTIVQLFKDSFPRILKGEIPRHMQDLAAGRYHRGTELEGASQIDLARSYRARDLLNLLRARTFRPHPAAWFVDDGEHYEVRVEIVRVPDRSES